MTNGWNRKDQGSKYYTVITCMKNHAVTNIAIACYNAGVEQSKLLLSEHTYGIAKNLAAYTNIRRVCGRSGLLRT